MERSIPSSWKHCVTCQRWGGPRRASKFRDRAEFSNNRDKGECIGGGWDRIQKTAMSTCKKWERWSVLK